MFGQIFLILYVIIQALMSVLTEYVIEKNRLYKGIGRKTRLFRIFIYILLAIIPVLGAFLPKSDFKYFCMRFGNLWFGFFAYYSGTAIFLTLILIIVSRIRKDDERRTVGHVLTFSLILGIVVTIYGLVHAQYPKTVR